MASIEIRTVIRSGLMGDNWVDKADATQAFASYLESEWSAELKPLSNSGHDYHLTIKCEPFSKERSYTDITVRGNGANELSARDVEDRLTPMYHVWNRWMIS